mgnify:CR=1 FL=1
MIYGNDPKPGMWEALYLQVLKTEHIEAGPIPANYTITDTK